MKLENAYRKPERLLRGREWRCRKQLVEWNRKTWLLKGFWKLLRNFCSRSAFLCSRFEMLSALDFRMWSRICDIRSSDVRRIHNNGEFVRWVDSHAHTSINRTVARSHAHKRRRANYVQSFITCAFFGSQPNGILIYAILIWSRWLELIFMALCWIQHRYVVSVSSHGARHKRTERN